MPWASVITHIDTNDEAEQNFILPRHRVDIEIDMRFGPPGEVEY